jgi:hypothetical protein
VGGVISNISSSINGIGGSLLSALSFQNISLSIFGCDITPKCPVSDHYTLQDGGSVTTDAPSAAQIAEESALKSGTAVTPPTVSPAFAPPNPTSAIG